MKPQILRVPLTSRINRPGRITRNADGDTLELRGETPRPLPPVLPSDPPQEAVGNDPAGGGMFLGKPAVVFISLIIIFLIAVACTAVAVRVLSHQITTHRGDAAERSLD